MEEWWNEKKIDGGMKYFNWKKEVMKERSLEVKSTHL